MDDQTPTPPIITPDPTPQPATTPSPNPATEPLTAPPTVPEPAPTADLTPVPEPTPIPEPTPVTSPMPEPTPEPASPPPASDPVPQAEPAPTTEPNPAPEQSTPATEPAPEAPTPGQTKKILLVEDDDALANVYQTRLQAEGFDVKRVPNGEDALSTAVQYKPDLVLLDVMMPKVSGFDVLDIMRNTPETANIKVIMLTALSQDSDKQRANQLGADDYLVKSQVVIADVVDRIKHHLNLQ